MQEGVGYLLGAFCGLFREVVVGVVSLRDATEQHGHDACKTTQRNALNTGTSEPNMSFVVLRLQNITQMIQNIQAFDIYLSCE